MMDVMRHIPLFEAIDQLKVLDKKQDTTVYKKRQP